MCRTKIETSEKSEDDVYVVPVRCKKSNDNIILLRS